MILDFLDFLKQNRINYKVTNGYNLIKEKRPSNNSDWDILLKKSDFNKINIIINNFCERYNYRLVQLYHQEVYAKNFFVYDELSHSILNLDLYGELSQLGVKILSEDDVFSSNVEHNEISILKPHQEFIHYLIKNIVKQNLPIKKFKTLYKLYVSDSDHICKRLKAFFPDKHELLIKCFTDNNYELLLKNLSVLKIDFLSLPKNAFKNRITNGFRILKRIIKPTGFSICFLGPDGSGKSTIINHIISCDLPFRRVDYFHLKPFPINPSENSKPVSDPHKFPPYSVIKSHIKLVYFIFQYNFGWIKNVFLIKRKSSLIIFDRYYDDLLVDYKRYRFGGSMKLAFWLRNFIPKPELYIILTADANVINKRKQEVSIKELKRQIADYRKLGKLNNYFNVDVDRNPDEIVNEVITLIMKKLNGRY